MGRLKYGQILTVRDDGTRLTSQVLVGVPVGDILRRRNKAAVVLSDPLAHLIEEVQSDRELRVDE